MHGAYELTKDEIVAFAGRWDPQPFHLDEEAAATSVFGGLSACSAHNFAIMSHLLNDRADGLVVLAGLGIEKMRFLTPARPGDRLSVRHTFLDKRASASRPSAGITKSSVQLINQDGETIVDAVTNALIAMRPTGAG